MKDRLNFLRHFPPAQPAVSVPDNVKQPDQCQAFGGNRTRQAAKLGKGWQVGCDYRNMKSTHKETGIEQCKAAMFARFVKGCDQSLRTHIRGGGRAVAFGLAGHGK